MRSDDSLDTKAVTYIDDDPILGGCIITGNCKNDCPQFTDKTKPDIPTYCPKCGIELFYRSWYEW